jgi:hypothetical protein
LLTKDGIKNPEQKLEELRRSSLVEVVQLVHPEVAKSSKHANLESIPESSKQPKKYAYTPKPPLMSHPSDDVSDLEIEERDHSPPTITKNPESAAARQSAPSASQSSTAPKKPPKPVAFSSPRYIKPGSERTG